MTKSLPVLLVDDEEILLAFLKTALERGGLSIVTASSGGDALDLLARGQFAAVVSDLKMPGDIGGEEIFNWVKENRPELSGRFLFITGDMSTPYAVQVQRRTGGLFIQKPFRIALLIELIQKITSRAHTTEPAVSSSQTAANDERAPEGRRD